MYDYQEQENKIIEKQKELREKLKAMMDDGYSTSSTIMESEAQLNEVIELKRQIIDMAKERDFKMKKSALDINEITQKLMDDSGQFMLVDEHSDTIEYPFDKKTARAIVEAAASVAIGILLLQDAAK